MRVGKGQNLTKKKRWQPSYPSTMPRRDAGIPVPLLNQIRVEEVFYRYDSFLDEHAKIVRAGKIIRQDTCTVG